MSLHNFPSLLFVLLEGEREDGNVNVLRIIMGKNSAALTVLWVPFQINQPCGVALITHRRIMAGKLTILSEKKSALNTSTFFGKCRLTLSQDIQGTWDTDTTAPYILKFLRE